MYIDFTHENMWVLNLLSKWLVSFYMYDKNRQWFGTNTSPGVRKASILVGQTAQHFVLSLCSSIMRLYSYDGQTYFQTYTGDISHIMDWQVRLCQSWEYLFSGKNYTPTHPLLFIKGGGGRHNRNITNQVLRSWTPSNDCMFNIDAHIEWFLMTCFSTTFHGFFPLTSCLIRACHRITLRNALSSPTYK